MKAISTLFLLAAACVSNVASAQGYSAHAESTARVTGSTADGHPQLGVWTATKSDGNYIGSGTFNRTATIINPGGSLNGKSTNGSANADLRTGKLGALASVSNSVSTSSNDISVTALSTAEFGDSYRFNDAAMGVPYSWASGASVSFQFHIDGSIVNTSTDPWAVSVQFNLELLKPGSIGPDYSSSNRLAYLTWGSTFGADGVLKMYTDQQDPQDPLQMSLFSLSGSFANGGYDLRADFNPGGDFDWRASLLVFAGLSTYTGSATTDLSHTATGSFSAPSDAVTTAASGFLLAPIAAVPEVDSNVLLAAGLSVLTWVGRRRSVKQTRD